MAMGFVLAYVGINLVLAILLASSWPKPGPNDRIGNDPVLLVGVALLLAWPSLYFLVNLVAAATSPPKGQ